MDDWLERHVFGDGPTAPYAWADLTGQRETVQTIWHADPIHLGIGRESVIIGSLAEDPLSDAEADALIAAANESLGDAARLSRVGLHWFLHARNAWSLAPPPLAAVVGRPFAARAALSDDELRWNRLHNAVQMTWHAHPVNEAREASARPHRRWLVAAWRRALERLVRRCDGRQCTVIDPNFGALQRLPGPSRGPHQRR